MLSNDPLREAATELRATVKGGGPVSEPEFKLAVADLLDQTARIRDSLGPNSRPWTAAYAVAHAVLGDDERFCPKCLAGTESAEHHEKCDNMPWEERW